MIKYDPISRRMFLVGGGCVIGIPLLTSLLPSKVEAAITGTPPVRFVSLINHYGTSEKNYYGQFAFNGQLSNLPLASGTSSVTRVGYKRLIDVTGDISYTLAPFSNLKSKTTVIRGLDVVAGDLSGAHPRNYALCAASGENPNESNGYMPSVDQMIAGSSKTYPSTWSSLRKILVLSPMYGSAEDLSRVLNPTGTGLNRTSLVAGIRDTSALMQRFIGSFGTTSTSTGTGSLAPGGIARRDILSRVLPAYQKVSSNSRLSAADKQKLDNYIALLSEIQKDYEAEAVVVSQCAAPSLETEGSYPNPPVVEGKRSGEGDDAFLQRSLAALEAENTWRQTARAVEDIRYRNHMKIMVAGMACDLTRVAYIGLPYDGQWDLSHSYHHSANIIGDTPTSSPYASAFFAQQRRAASIVASLMNMMNSINESNGTMLDNSIVYWGQQFGCIYVRGDAHSRHSMPTVVGGGGGGKLNTGHFIDYHQKVIGVGYQNSEMLPHGTAINNLLVTFMNCFGMNSSDYEYQPGQGYGNYDKLDTAKYNAALLTSAARRSPLPFFYKGQLLG